ncbi:hypothetical protein [Flavobacterium tyrosinilyticum]|uniref:hypothetical protein n=1 Tax=Flavobacterium tyrosinilyticum TaxID=1658740 RepID=UPI00202F4789|nr:hypothetical protein [Flavobacterium tyrosinilyticum]MCM0667732.1 hypothetical protein [Flavobacterium tyrosinilyticum]
MVNPIKNIKEALELKLFPTVMMWNRLEGRPRAHNFDRALKAEVRDALWMLTKQWQMGEFKADDAGSPVFAKIHITSSHLQKYKAAANAIQNFENNVPLEAKTEQKKIAFKREEKKISIDIRLQMGRYWLQLLKKYALNYRDIYIENYGFTMPPNNRDNAAIYAHKNVWQQYAAISGRAMDGYALYEKIILGTSASDGIVLSDPGHQTVLDNDLTNDFKDWYAKIYLQPNDEKNTAWLPNKLEYQFECSATAEKTEKKLSAAEYYQGHPDWYVFDIEEQKTNDTGEPLNKFTDTFIPSHIAFEGMPDRRWWQFEDSKTDLGDIKPSTTELSKLLLMEFGLVFANDWFLVPYTLPIGSLANIEGLTVKNNFGETIWIKPTEEIGKENMSWSMYKLHSEKQNNTLFLSPTAMKVHESDPIEEIVLIRDEISNMVWGIETVIPSPAGIGEKGSEAALRVRQFHENIVNKNTPIATLPYSAKISYQAMSNVPENWIPFVPVHKKNDNREIQLQRASLLRIIEKDQETPKKIKPQSSILREGLDEIPKPLPYYIHEEEIPRAGVKVSQSFQRTRWLNGEVFVWLGMKKKIGRGEGSSNLAFDQIKDVKD